MARYIIIIKIYKNSYMVRYSSTLYIEIFSTQQNSIIKFITRVVFNIILICTDSDINQPAMKIKTKHTRVRKIITV